MCASGGFARKGRLWYSFQRAGKAVSMIIKASDVASSFDICFELGDSELPESKRLHASLSSLGEGMVGGMGLRTKRASLCAEPAASSASTLSVSSLLSTSPAKPTVTNANSVCAKVISILPRKNNNYSGHKGHLITWIDAMRDQSPPRFHSLHGDSTEAMKAAMHNAWLVSIFNTWLFGKAVESLNRPSPARYSISEILRVSCESHQLWTLDGSEFPQLMYSLDSRRAFVLGGLMNSYFCNLQDKHPSALSSNSLDRLLKLAKSKQIVIFLDYDGTLSPIVDDPDKAFMSDEVNILPSIISVNCSYILLQDLSSCTLHCFFFLFEISISHKFFINWIIRLCGGWYTVYYVLSIYKMVVRRS